MFELSKHGDNHRMAGRFKDKVAIVTGAAQGIGASYAKALAEQGADVAICDVISTDATVARIQEAGGQAIGFDCDITSAKLVQAMVQATVERFGKIDILVNNAGLFGNLALKPFREIDSAEWDRVMAINVRGSFECVKAVAPHMTRQKYGKIVNVSSGTVFKGTQMLLHYVASKGAIIAMTRCLARELGDSGIRVNAIAPGLVMSENVVGNPAWKSEIISSNIASRAIKREAVPDDMIGTLLFLCSPDSDFITGQTLVVDGGSVMH
jgi:NAD(P)-dependent dehydrogenase (short-subunit alcohol dehydrogenase family)